MEKSIAATLYPKQIIIATRIGNGNEYGSIWMTTDCLSILSPEVSNYELGVVVLRHILLSNVRPIVGTEAIDFNKKYNRLCKFKTEGQAMKDSKLATVFLTEHDLRFEPKNNRYSQVKRRYYEYQGMPDAKYTIAYPCTPEIIGANLHKAWAMASIT